MRTSSILGKLQLDLWCFYFLPIVSLFFMGYSDNSLTLLIIVFTFFDSGHVYTTFLRTLPDLRRRGPRYWATPVLLFAFISGLYFFYPAWVWRLAVYATFYHHLRQVYGVTRWYEAKSGRSDEFTPHFSYALSIMPFLAYHFRSGVSGKYYTSFDLLLYPDQNIYVFLVSVYIGVVLLFIGREVKRYRQCQFELGRTTSLALPALIYGVAFLNGEKATDVLVPLILLHAPTYMALMSMTLSRNRSLSFVWSVALVLVVALVLGGVECWFEPMIMESKNPFLVGLLLTPLFSHYVFDAWIWKRNHPEMSALYAKIPTT